MYEPKHTTRMRISAYGGETIALARPFNKLKSILGEPPSMQPLKDPTGGTSPKLRLRLPMTPRPAPFEQNLRGSHDSNAILMPRLEPEEKRPPRRHGVDSRKVRPSALQKLVKKYDGSGDPFDHIATFKQVVHAKQVFDTHTQIEGFGLTLESKALMWFQTLELVSKTSFDRLEKDFIGSFSKMGLRHNALALI